jgi:hypothetical protein
MSSRKEPAFFTVTRNWHRGLAWYQSQWVETNDVMGEASPQYTYVEDWETVPARMLDVVPDVKLILGVRDPIDRMVSHYLHSFKKRDELKPFAQAVTHPTLEGSFYTQCSRYYTILSQYLRYFDRQQIHVVVLEQLKASPATEMKRIFQFLGVDDDFYSPAFEKPANRTARQKRKTLVGYLLSRARRQIPMEQIPLPATVKAFYHDSIARRPLVRPEVDDELRHRLVDELRSEVEQLRQEIGSNLEQWSV